MTAASEQLPLRVKLAYGAPSFAGAAMAIPIGIHLTIFYSDAILVPLGFIAIVKALARVLDAITDPLMGWMSDRTHSRWGRRRPWIAVGAPLAAIAFFAMFTPPGTVSGVNAAAWFAATYTLYYVFHTVYIIPHYGLGPELTLDYHERSVLFGFREGFVVMGTMCAAVLPPILISVLGTERAGYTSFAAIFGSLLALLYFNLIWQVRERPDFVQRESNPLVPGMRRVMRNRVFRILLAVYLVGSITGAIPGLMMPYFTKYVIQPENPDMWLGIFLFVYFGAGFLFLPVWVWAARRYEKKPVWLASFIPGFTASLSIFFFLDKGDIIPFAVLLVWAGAAFGAGLFLGPSMQADVIDYDELYTGKRREAQYGALWSVITKFAVIPSMSVPLAILATVGYVPNVEQSETVQFAIRAIFGLAPASTAAIAFVIACFYPISRRVHEQIWRGIDQHARGESALDPITGHIVRPPTNRGMDEETSWYLDHYSLGELDRVARGRKGLSKRTALLSGLSLLVFCFACAGVVGEVDMSSEPGLIAVLYVVVAGVAITAFTYHLIRAMASSRIRRIDRTTIETHIDLTKELASGIEHPLPAGAISGS